MKVQWKKQSGPLEPGLNGRRVVLLDVPEVEQQLLGLVWRGGKIDHPTGEHDDWANAVTGVAAALLVEGFKCGWCDRPACSGFHVFVGGLPPRSPVDQARTDAERDELARAHSAALVEDAVRRPHCLREIKLPVLSALAAGAAVCARDEGRVTVSPEITAPPGRAGRSRGAQRERAPPCFARPRPSYAARGSRTR